VGVSAGASAPEYIVKEIIEFLQKNGATDIVEVGSDLKEKSFPLPKEVRP
jgi:4-hydroxy-3-methylbut-2-enyl diphosphate reductase